MKYPVRLDKFISNSTDYSRSDVKKQIKSGDVVINQSVIRNPATPVAAEDKVCLHGSPVHATELTYWMMNKPAGVVCDRGDAHYPCAMDLIEGFFNPPLHCAGRLDADTTGMLLLTNDGQWSHQIASPNRLKTKTYLTRLAAPVTQASLAPLCEGILLRGESKPTRPAQVQLISPYQVELTITEGRYHQVKRMFAAIGNRVEELHRQQVGTIALDTSLSPGEYRPLTTEEIQGLSV